MPHYKKIIPSSSPTLLFNQIGLLLFEKTAEKLIVIGLLYIYLR